MAELTTLAAWRAAAGLTQAQAALKVGVSQPAWHDWEKGRRSPSLSNAVAIELLSNGAVAVEAFGFTEADVAGVSKLLARRRRAAARATEGGAS